MKPTRRPLASPPDPRRLARILAERKQLEVAAFGSSV